MHYYKQMILYGQPNSKGIMYHTNPSRQRLRLHQLPHDL